eukprot:GHUV01006645.1.p1 GENE.GHUV01006645.1~~GHUV01006645.1.p1  ORF type:complete len:453 (+),score=180.42 GHUV01006645.1:50-1408(+)
MHCCLPGCKVHAAAQAAAGWLHVSSLLLLPRNACEHHPLQDRLLARPSAPPCPQHSKCISPTSVSCPHCRLHPARFRTQMCKKGNQCNRTLCFFAHSASELRFPDTQDDLEAAAVDAAAASATATPLSLCTAASSSLTSSQAFSFAGGGVAMLPATASGSSFGMQSLVGMGQVCSDGSAGGFGLLQVPAVQHLPQQQLILQQDEAGSCYEGSDSAMQVPVIGVPQNDSQSISDPLPRLGSGMAAGNPTARLQMAAAAQLSGNQIMSQISRPPGQQQVQLQLPTPQAATLMPTAVPSMEAAYAAATGMARVQDLQHGAAQQNVFVVANPAAKTLINADMLSAGLAGISLADDSSGSSSCMAGMSNEQYLAALNAANAGRPYDISMLQQTVPSPNRNENMLLLQHLQQHQQLQQQQQQLIKLSSGGSAVSRQSSGSVYMGGAQLQGTGSWVRMV